jgi:hypothetical protein
VDTDDADLSQPSRGKAVSRPRFEPNTFATSLEHYRYTNLYGVTTEPVYVCLGLEYPNCFAVEVIVVYFASLSTNFALLSKNFAPTSQCSPNLHLTAGETSTEKSILKKATATISSLHFLLALICPIAKEVLPHTWGKYERSSYLN